MYIANVENLKNAIRNSKGLDIQTFLPYKDFTQSAICLDWQRLGKQRVEVIQLLEALEDHSRREYRHPACKMWYGYQDALIAYGLAMCTEWTRRGYVDNSYDKILNFAIVTFIPTQYNVSTPKWLGDAGFHSSHRANLLRKDYKWYRTFGWTELPSTPYIWPVNPEIK